MGYVRKASNPPKMAKGKLSEIREKPGMSGAYKHKSSSYAGPNHTFPIGNISHARNALARAHYAKDPEAVKRKVYEKYPGLKKRKQERK